MVIPDTFRQISGSSSNGHCKGYVFVDVPPTYIYIWFLYGTVPPFQGPEIPIGLISFCLAATFQPAQALLNGVRDRAGEAAAQLGLKNPARFWGNFGCFFDQPEMVVAIKFGV